MLKIQCDINATNADVLNKYSFLNIEYLDEDDDGVVAFVEGLTGDDLRQLHEDNEVNITEVYVPNEYKHLFNKFISFPNDEHIFALSGDDNDINEIIQIIMNN